MLGWLFKSGRQAALAGGPAQASAAGASLEQAMEHHRAGRLQQAADAYRAVLTANPENADALHLLGVVEFQGGRYEQAAERIARSLALAEPNPAAHSNLGAVRAAQGRLEDAVRCFRRALELQPAHPNALLGLANAQHALGHAEEALALLRRALTIRPDFAEAHSDLGNILRELGRAEESAASCRAALALQPGLAEAHSNLGNVLDDAGRTEEAIACYRQAVALKPSFAAARANLGNSLMSIGELREAGEHLREALRLDPALARARFAQANLALLQGDYEAGLPLYEARFDAGAVSGMYAGLRARAAAFRGTPQWRGEAGAGRTLLVWTEQGLGDSLMMLRYIALLKARGFARVVVYCDRELERIVRTIAQVDEVIARGEAPPPLQGIDLHCPVMSLPFAFATRLESVPRQVPYFFVPDALQRAWAQRLPGAPAVRVGLVWSGGWRYPRNAQRSVQFAQYAPLLASAGVHFVSLQQGDPAAQLAGSGAAVIDWMDECRDLIDTAALVSQLDLVISVDTAMAHLAGALGKPVWMLNRFESEWRWLLAREDSPWYPTMRIYRQPAPGRWDEVIARVAAALPGFVAARSAHG